MSAGEPEAMTRPYTSTVMRSASANTASMSCSISRIVSSRLSSRSVFTMRADSSGPRPAIGSSSRSMGGFEGSAMASPKWRCSPRGMLDSMVLARCVSPTRSSAMRAGSRNSLSVRAGRQNRNECPAWACTASATFSSAVKCGNNDVIWNERARPRRLRSCTGSAVMSRPSKWMRPAFGTISPQSWPISVVLPAPFGPMMACSSPLLTSSPTLSEAITPPKRLVRPSMASSASAMAFDLARRPGQQSIDAAAGEQHDQQQHRTEDKLPVFARTLHLMAGQKLARSANQYRQRLFQHQQRDRADHWAEHRAHAAKHRHDDQIARAGPEHDRGVDEIGVVGQQNACEAAHHAGDDKVGQLVAVGRKSDRAHAALVGARTLDHHAEARVHQPPHQVDASEQQHEAQIIEERLIGEVD